VRFHRFSILYGRHIIYRLIVSIPFFFLIANFTYYKLFY
jgi:hypothetical protein